jgi:hypothetical protein
MNIWTRLAFGSFDGIIDLEFLFLSWVGVNIEKGVAIHNFRACGDAPFWLIVCCLFLVLRKCWSVNTWEAIHKLIAFGRYPELFIVCCLIHILRKCWSVNIKETPFTNSLPSADIPNYSYFLSYSSFWSESIYRILL